MLVFEYMEKLQNDTASISKETESDVSAIESPDTDRIQTEEIPHIGEAADEAKIAKQRVSDTTKLAKLREKLGLIPKRVAEWWNSKEGHPKTNILYKEDRMYRCIGPNGYADFIDSGIIRSKNRNKYQDVSFNIGGPAPLYMEGSSGDFILEVAPDATDFEFKINPYSLSGEPMKDIPYRGCANGSLTKDSSIRIFRRVEQNADGSIYEVVFDNIGDVALVE
ncbi:MAG: hypothetical protein QG568_313 [Patescibacteria group bacterium]|nr:hypothetical protein [Patescibacteria group bacterium]